MNLLSEIEMQYVRYVERYRRDPNLFLLSKATKDAICIEIDELVDERSSPPICRTQRYRGIPLVEDERISFGKINPI